MYNLCNKIFESVTSLKKCWIGRIDPFVSAGLSYNIMLYENGGGFGCGGQVPVEMDVVVERNRQDVAKVRLTEHVCQHTSTHGFAWIPIPLHDMLLL